MKRKSDFKLTSDTDEIKQVMELEETENGK